MANQSARHMVVLERVAARSVSQQQLAQVSGIGDAGFLGLILLPVGLGVYYLYKGQWVLGAGLVLLGPAIAVAGLWLFAAAWSEKS